MMLRVFINWVTRRQSIIDSAVCCMEPMPNGGGRFCIRVRGHTGLHVGKGHPKGDPVAPTGWE